MVDFTFIKHFHFATMLRDLRLNQTLTDELSYYLFDIKMQLRNVERSFNGDNSFDRRLFAARKAI